MNSTMYTCWSLLQDVFNEYLDWWDCFCTTALQYPLLCSLQFSPLAALGMPSLQVHLEIALYHTHNSSITMPVRVLAGFCHNALVFQIMLLDLQTQ
jgi:hypothetical protein